MKLFRLFMIVVFGVPALVVGYIAAHVAAGFITGMALQAKFATDPDNKTSP